MDGPHDLGGVHGMGPIDPEPEGTEPRFHAEWEKRAMALTLAAASLGRWNLDMIRHARERQHPLDYLRNSYYENWLEGLETLLVETGVLTEEELASGVPSGHADPALRDKALRPERVAEVMAQGQSAERLIDATARFSVGNRVRVVAAHPPGHTRAPRYVRGRAGTIHAHHGAHGYPDRGAANEQVGRHLYSVRFEAQALWGADARGPGAVYLDLWEPYLEPA